MIKKIFLKRGLLLLMAMLAVLAMTATPALAVATWQPVGSLGFSSGEADYESLYVYNGTPYLAYADVASGEAYGPATVMEYNGGSWQMVGGAPVSSGETCDESLFVSNGTPYLAYEDGPSGPATVMEYTGGSWQMVGGAPVSSGEAAGESLYVYNGTPYVAYQDGGPGSQVTVMEYTGGSWQTLGSHNSNMWTNYDSLYVSNGTPYVAYEDMPNDEKATVMEYTGGSWQMVGGAPVSSSVTCDESLYVYNGTPYVAYVEGQGFGDFAGVTMPATPVTVMEYTGGLWQMVGGAPVSSDAGGGSLYVYNGTPYVTINDKVMEYTGGSWQQVGGSAVSSGKADYESLYVYNGTPYVAYADVANGDKATVMEYPAIQVNINGSSLQMPVAPQIVNGRTLVPLRAIFEALGATVQWNPADQSITATKGSTTIKLVIGSTTALNDGAPVALDAAPMIAGGSTLVPARFIGEALGAQVNWDPTNRQVNIVTTSP